MKKVRRDATAFERELAEMLEGQRVFLSGAGMEKADVRKRAGYALKDGEYTRTNRLAFRVECKTTRQAHYTLRSAEWADLVRAADMAGETPLFAIQFLCSGYTIVVARMGFTQELFEGEYLPRADFGTLNKSMRLRGDSFGRLAIHYNVQPFGSQKFFKRIDEAAVLDGYHLMREIKQHAFF